MKLNLKDAPEIRLIKKEIECLELEKDLGVLEYKCQQAFTWGAIAGMLFCTIVLIICLYIER